MGSSKRSRRGIAVFNMLQHKNLKYLAPQLTAHEEALKMNDRFDIEKQQKEARYVRNQTNRSNA